MTASTFESGSASLTPSAPGSAKAGVDRPLEMGQVFG